MTGKINRNNYPVWITDYHDGTLNSRRQEELLSFLSDNPDLMEEFEQYDPIPLRPRPTIMSVSKNLRKEFAELTSTQQEEITAAMAEGDITGTAAEETMLHINASSYLTDLYNLLKVIRLRPENIIFKHKKSLKHYPLILRFKKTTVTIFATAASIAILFTISFLFTRDKTPSEPLASSAETDPVVITRSNRDATKITTEEQIMEREKREAPFNHDIINPAKGRITSPAKGDSKIYGTSTRESENLTGIESKRERIDPIPILHIATTPLVMATAPATRLAEMTPVEFIDNYSYNSPREFIAKNFREIFLGEPNATTERLQPIELANATVTGINKLLGWEMKLEKESNENGMLNSISFTSQLIKFDHKLKNSTN